MFKFCDFIYLLWLAVRKSSFFQNNGNFAWNFPGWDDAWSPVLCVSLNIWVGHLLCFCKFLWIVDGPVRICFYWERARSWSQFRINFNQNTAWDLSSEHWRDLINFETISFLSSLIGRLSKIVTYLVCPSRWGELSSLSRRLYFFSVPGKIMYSFFNSLYDILK